jgi:signal transduction histidine kinase
VASVTGFVHRYRDDSFLRTEVNLIALQFGYALLVVAVSTTALYILYHEVLRGVTAAIVTALTSATPTSPEGVLGNLEVVRTRNIIALVATIFATATIFGYLVTRFALAPARDALAAQKRFIGNIAHELRTPLSVIRTNTEVRLLDPNVSKEARAVHESNLEELNRISNLINNLLTLNALLRPGELPFGNVDLGKIVGRVFERLAPLARRHKVRMKMRVTRGYPVWGNRAALEQIVTNLVKNAVQHTQKGEVRVAVGPALHGIELDIVDTGTGIRHEDLLRIFEPFYRGDRARTRSGGSGSGLGLTIVNELIKLHRGRIRIQSAPGVGTRVSVVFPRGHLAHAQESGQRTLMASEVSEAQADFWRD